MADIVELSSDEGYGRRSQAIDVSDRPSAARTDRQSAAATCLPQPKPVVQNLPCLLLSSSSSLIISPRQWMHILMTAVIADSLVVLPCAVLYQRH